MEGTKRIPTETAAPRRPGRRRWAPAPFVGIALLATGCDEPLLSINPNAPPTPGGLMVQAGDEEVLLTWDDVVYLPNQGHAFNVFQGTSPQSLVKIAGPFPTALEYVARGLTNGTTYYFAVSAESFGAESARSAVADVAPEAHYLVEGWGVGRAGQQVRVTRRTVGIEGAEVRVEGTSLTHIGDGVYAGDLADAPAAGTIMTVEAVVGESLVVGTGEIPLTPVLTAPADDATYSPDQLVPVAWELLDDPDGFQVRVCWDECAAFQTFTLTDGSARSFEFSPLGLPVDLFSEYTIEVLSHNLGSFTGPHESGSRMELPAASDPGGGRTVRLLP
ncbi:MAG: fibronectin type III domain-containing protein [Gemmatimonadota bacterium]